MDLPLSETILQTAYEVAVNAANDLLNQKYKALERIEKKDLSTVTDADCFKHQALQKDILILAGIITAFEDHVKSLLSLISSQQDTISMHSERNNFLLKEYVELLEKSYKLKEPFVPEVDYVPGSIRNQIKFLLKK